MLAPVSAGRGPARVSRRGDAPQPEREEEMAASKKPAAKTQAAKKTAAKKPAAKKPAPKATGGK